ncbi:MAG: hypothetical protein BWZ10_01909 [candidate division BRC1 bacterium ADurb.BinA364]|nr:MAG: hypothetical protein BWZ10_01909 [candidate division BRC1 bacterium ADurb.BinA364]
MVGGVEPVALGVPLGTGGVAGARRALVLRFVAGFGPLLLGGLGPLVELQGEAIDQFGRAGHVQPPGVKIGLQIGPGVLVEPPGRIVVHRRVENHVQQPDGLQRLPEGPRGPGGRLAQVGGHLAQLFGSGRIGAKRLALAAQGQPLGEVDYGLQSDLDGIEKGVFLGVARLGPLGASLLQDAAEPQPQKPRIIRHDVAETAQAAASLRRFAPLLFGRVVGKSFFGVNPGSLQRHRPGEELAVPQVRGHGGEFERDGARLAHGDRFAHPGGVDGFGASPGAGRRLHRFAHAAAQVGGARRIGDGGGFGGHRLGGPGFQVQHADASSGILLTPLCGYNGIGPGNCPYIRSRADRQERCASAGGRLVS